MTLLQSTVTKLLSFAAATIALVGCQQDSCKEYSRFTCKQLEQQTFNVYYYDTPESTERLLGSAVGLQQCASVAWSAAHARKKESSDDWSYVCCLQTEDSSCAEKHR